MLPTLNKRDFVRSDLSNNLGLRAKVDVIECLENYNANKSQDYLR